LRRARVDGPVARLRLSHLLASASLNPPGMPPSAILLVRTMADPLPGRITKAFAPAALAGAEWERAAQNSLGEFHRSAARPMWGPVPSNAAAVLFADYGELLACLARDLASGTALGWWWQSILRRIPVRLPGSWSAVWAEEPLYIPAALEYLDARRQAVQVLERIAPVQAWNLLTILLRVFELPGLMIPRVPTGATEPEPVVSWTTSMEPRVEYAAEIVRAAAQPAGAAAIAPFPWEPYVPRASTPEELGYERQALLGIGLLLRRVPHVAFTPAFALRFRAWVRAAESGGRALEADSSPPHVPSGNPPSGDLNGEKAPWEALPARLPGSLIPADGQLPAPGEFDQTGGRRRDSAPADTTVEATDRVQPNRVFAHAETTNLPPNQAQVRDATPAEATGRATDRITPNQAQVEDATAETVQSTLARDPEAGELTRAGGILYLIHFLRQAQLLRHFDTGLGGWALLELLARCLLDQAPNLADDPIWASLARLDGRDARTPPGSGFRPRRTYEAPASWVEGVVGPSRFARFRSRGMEIWTGEGFLVLDSQDGGRPSGAPERLPSARRRELRPLARVRPVSLSVSPELRRFLHFVLPYARWRLDGALQGARLSDALLRAGKLYVTATHVDLVMPLREISVPVRMAGLDANPGWIPELGRIVNFHFT